MSRFAPDPEQVKKRLRDKVAVLTGGASGIGAATVQLLYDLGVKVVFGDINGEAGEAKAKQYPSHDVKFVRTDITKYQDLIALFDVALHSFGRVDFAISNAGAMEAGNFVNPDLSLEEIKQAPSTRTLDVNLLGTLYFTRVAVVYLRQNQTKDDDKSIILTSSVGAFKETPGMPVYLATKHGVLGILRGLKLTLPDAANIRINAVCPWFVKTIMTAGIADKWRKANLPMNDTEGIAAVYAGLAAERGMNGRAIYVEGNRGWEYDENIRRLEPQWLGEENSKELNRGNALMGSGEFWQA